MCGSYTSVSAYNLPRVSCPRVGLSVRCRVTLPCTHSSESCETLHPSEFLPNDTRPLRGASDKLPLPFHRECWPRVGYLLTYLLTSISRRSTVSIVKWVNTHHKVNSKLLSSLNRGQGSTFWGESAQSQIHPDTADCAEWSNSASPDVIDDIVRSGC